MIAFDSSTSLNQIYIVELLSLVHHLEEKLDENRESQRVVRELAADFKPEQDEDFWMHGSKDISATPELTRAHSIVKDSIDRDALQKAIIQWRKLKKIQDYQSQSNDSIWEQHSNITQLCADPTIARRPLEDDEVDFDALSETHFPEYSGEEVKLQWQNKAAPWLNKKKWSKTETSKLLELTGAEVENDCHDWLRIAKNLGTIRTPLQCMQKYMKEKLARSKTPRWEPKEDQRLERLILMLGEEDWRAISLGVPGRAFGQCYHRWRKAARPGIVRGKWNEEEDIRLILAKKFLEDEKENVEWDALVPFVSNRTGVKIRERYLEKIDPKRPMLEFSEEDSIWMMALVEQVGTKWAKISRCFKNKYSSRQCRKEYLRVTNKQKVEEKRRQAALKKKKTQEATEKTCKVNHVFGELVPSHFNSRKRKNSNNEQNSPPKRWKPASRTSSQTFFPLVG